MGYLTYLVENQDRARSDGELLRHWLSRKDALMADVMLGQEKMESVLQGLRQGRVLSF